MTHKFTTLTRSKKITLSENAKKIFDKRYALKNQLGEVLESPEQGFYRVASHVAAGEKAQKLKDTYTQAFYDLMASKRFVPNAPTWTGSKTRLGQLAACFVLPIHDDMGKAPGGIFNTLRDAALIQQTGGGNGFSFSRLRPHGDVVGGSNGQASGPVSFLAAYDKAFGQIAQGGVRRGANMAVLRVDHPDIFDFIKCKAAEGEVANFNISVAITDKFMEAVKSDDMFELINPRTKKVWRTVKAREIMDEIIKYAHRNGEPGILFIDQANKYNPVPNQYELEATNPCGEQWLGPYENCCLGHVNILASVINSKMDWEHLRESVVLGTRFLDDVVTQNAYVPAVPQLKKAAMKNRRIGLGFMGLADAMYAMNIRYGSKESLDFASQVTEFIRFYAMRTSIDLAMERGPFPGITGSVYDKKNLLWEIPTPLVDYKLELKRPKLNWQTILNDIKKYGIRNSTQTTVAPTGSTATVYDLEGYGCEPVFALAYYRNVYQASGSAEGLQLTYVSPLFQKAIDKLTISDELKKQIVEHVIENGSLQHLDIVPESLKHTFVVSSDISADEHVWLQAVIQRFIDNSISKTCNFPENATLEDVERAYVRAWELGCKGLTVYVTGSRSEVVLETKSTKDKKLNTDEASATQESHETVYENKVMAKRPRPTVVVGRTHEISTPYGKAFVTVNRNGETGTAPFEVFITLGKSGSDSAAFAEALGRLASGWLRSAGDPNKALEEIAYQLQGIGGFSSIGFGINRITSIPDAVAKVLLNEIDLTKRIQETGVKLLGEDHLASQQALFEENPAEVFVAKDNLFKNASVCPECSNMTLIEIEGCIKCQNCGHSRC